MKRKLVLALVVCVSVVVIGTAMAASQNGRAGTMQAYYDSNLFTINFKHMPAGATDSLLKHNKSINTIYVVESAETSEEAGFTPVLDAIQGDGFNPLWQEVRILFNNATFPQRQLLSDTEILADADAGLITLDSQDELYRCSVIGPKKK
jgi:hypothetical protein